MLSMNQLSVQMEDFDESKGLNYNINFNNNSLKKGNNSVINTSVFDNQSNSRQLFRKCKQIIQQQMIQIKSLSEQNERLSNEIRQWQQDSKEKQVGIQKIMSQNKEILDKNEILHKEMSKLKKSIQDLNKQQVNKENMMKLKQNKIQLLQDNLNKTVLQKNTLEEKCQILQQTVQLLKRQLNKAQQIVKQKQLEIRQEISQLRRVKSILQRNTKLQQIDQILINNIKNNQISYSQTKNHNLICKPYYTVKQSTPFNKVNLNDQLNTYQNSYHQLPQRSQFYSAQLTRDSSNKSNINPFSIVNQKPNTSLSRIKKNFSKSNHTHNTPIHNTAKSSQSKSKLNQTHTAKPSNKKQTSFIMNSTNQLTNPQISQEISNIKKQILQQYTKMEIKKGLVSHDRINQTLQQIQNKLQKMAKISAFDQSQSQFQ